MTVKERIKKFVGFKRISIREFERLSNLNYGYVNAIRISIQPDKINNIALAFPELNITWLITGEGEMIKPKTLIDNAQNDNRIIELNNKIDQLEKDIERYQKQIDLLLLQLETLTK